MRSTGLNTRLNTGRHPVTATRVATRAIGAGLLLLATMGALPNSVQAQTPVGLAEGVQVRLLSLVSLDFAQTNPLPASGAMQSATVASASAINTLSTGLISASTAGTPLNGVTSVVSSATVNDLVLFPPLVVGTSLLTADSVTSTTTALNSFSSSGSSTITNLMFGGNSINVTGDANQTVSIAGVATLVINEQTVVGNVRTTNALHLTVLSGANAGDVLVSQSVAGFTGPAVGAPEPGTLPLLGMGLTAGLGMVGTVKRRKTKAKQARN